jgi:hypothetical protein
VRNHYTQRHLVCERSRYNLVDLWDVVSWKLGTWIWRSTITFYIHLEGMALGAVMVYGLNCCIDSERGIMSSGETDASTHNAIESYSQYGAVIFDIMVFPTAR